MADSGRSVRRPARRSVLGALGAAAGALTAEVTVGGAWVPPAFAATSSRVPGVNRFVVPVETRQVVVVRTTSTTTSHAQVETWRRASASAAWVRTSGPHPGRVGYNGVSATRVQNSGKTPSGMFRLLGTFGPGPNPGTAMGWTRFDERHWWVYDPRDRPTYNMIQQRLPGRTYRWRTTWAEHLVSFGGREYKYAVTIDWNKPGTGRSDVRLGGGIFLHADGPGATAGCVSVEEAYVRSIVRWLDPVTRPRIIIGSTPWLAARL